MLLGYFRRTLQQLVETSCPFLLLPTSCHFCRSDRDDVFRHRKPADSLAFYGNRANISLNSIEDSKNETTAHYPKQEEEKGTPSRGLGGSVVSQKSREWIHDNGNQEKDLLTKEIPPMPKSEQVLTIKVTRSQLKEDVDQKRLLTGTNDPPEDPDMTKNPEADHALLESEDGGNGLKPDGQMDQLDISTSRGTPPDSNPSEEGEDTHADTKEDSVPDIPPDIVGYSIAPFLNDRFTFNSVMGSCKEIYDICKTLQPPWPGSRLPTGAAGVWSAAFSPDGSILACGGSDGVIRTWNRVTGKMTPLKGHLGRVYSVVFAPSGDVMASRSADGGIRLWNINNDFSCRPLKSQTPHVDCIAFSIDGKILASGGDGMVRLWSTETGRGLAVIQQDNQVVESVAFSPDGSTLACGTWGKTIRIFDLHTKECVKTLFESTCVHSIAFSPDGKLLVSGSDGRTIRLWNIEDHTYSILKGHTDMVWSVAFSPDGEKIASGSDDGTVRVWALESSMGDTFECETVVTGHKKPRSVYCVSFAPDGKTLVSGSDDGYIQLTMHRTDREIKSQA